MKVRSTEEMKEKPSSSLEEEMRTWRGLDQEEMDQCWKKLAGNGEGSPGQVQGRRQQKRGLQRQRFSTGMEACTKKQQIQDTKVEVRLLGKNLRLVQRIQPAASAKLA